MTPLDKKLESARSLSPKRRRALMDLLLFVADDGPATTKTIEAALTIPNIADLIAAGLDAEILQRDRAGDKIDKLGRGRPVYRYFLDASITKAQIEAVIGQPTPKPSIEIVSDRSGLSDQQLLALLTEMAQQIKSLDLRVRHLERINALYDQACTDAIEVLRGA
jgi:hypothetical protein